MFTRFMESHEVHIYVRFKTMTAKTKTDDAWSVCHLDFSRAVIEDSHKAKLRRLICLHRDVQGFEPVFQLCFSTFFCDFKLKLTSFLICIALLN